MTNPEIAAGLRAAVLLLQWQASNLALQFIIIFAFLRSSIVIVLPDLSQSQMSTSSRSPGAPEVGKSMGCSSAVNSVYKNTFFRARSHEDRFDRRYGT
ncbi:hypothetical protein GIB67_033702 [Kingdonia uniflora]|uniref:Uncharacterized protein n=1 Tax=Kingdonia uniflora TaxID=39325 RepID=A0A7J7P4A1_9MAGN|nr:hypothetical protein GIB67_033702 [Kingdonia uniflora]